MTTRSRIEEARRELIQARTFQREPADWAVALANEVRRVDESELDRLDDMAFGRVRMPEGAEDPMEPHFRDAGLCEESARQAAAGLREGRYFSFTDAAIAQTAFDTEGRNRAASPQRISEAARAVEGAAGDGSGHQGVTEADLDALDEATFGRLVNAIDARIMARRRNR